MRAFLIAIFFAFSLTGCEWMFQTRPTPKVGDIYALYPDAFCLNARVLVTGVQGRFVKIRHRSGREEAEEMWKFTDGSWHRIVYELDPYKCDQRTKEKTNG